MHSRKIAAVLLHLVLSLALCALIACGGGGSSSSGPGSSDPPPAPAPPPNPTPSSVPSTTSQYGQWSTLPYTLPINPVHAALLHTGKVLVLAGSGNDPKNAFPINTNPDYEAAVWDPQAGKITTQRVSWDMFCNGMSLMQDGRVLINGGTASYGSLAVVGGASDTPFTGLPNSAIFDPATETFSVADGPNSGNTAHGRWYPTVTELGDGRMMTTSGLDENGNVNNTSEIYTPGQGWGAEIPGNPTGITDPTFTFGFPLYPRMHLLPSGQVFYSAPSSATLVFDPSKQTWALLAWTIYGGPVAERTYGSSVLLPLTPANNYDPKVMILGGDNPATSTTEIIDLGQTSPAWQQGPPMAEPRVEMEATLLPSGKVLISAGSAADEDPNTASLKAELYDPATNGFSSAGANTIPRLYHNVQLLLPDGTVFLAGGNPQQGVYENRIELYKPAYLFNPDGSPATRPVINSAPASVAYASSFNVQTASPDIGSIILMKAGSVTHSFDMDQRFVGLTFTAASGGYSVNVPSNSNLLPPGYYMLFLVNKAGVPSIAKFVQVSGTVTAVAAISYKARTTVPPYAVFRRQHVTESPLRMRNMMHIH